MLSSTADDLCPVCGWALREPARTRGAPSWDTCPACGTTFGLDGELEAYLGRVRPSVEADCRALVARLAAG